MLLQVFPPVAIAVAGVVVVTVVVGGVCVAGLVLVLCLLPLLMLRILLVPLVPRQRRLLLPYVAITIVAMFAIAVICSARISP